MNILSPLTKQSNTKILRKIDCSFIYDQYKSLEIDVGRFFANIDEILEVKCLDTNYRFFYPSTVSGDGKFYQELQKYPWYYNHWKWEHQQAAELIEHATRVLEIGCGPGEFIKQISKTNFCQCIGLELNEKALKQGQLAGLDIRNDQIHAFADQNANTFDTVCSFHVLEHIADVRPFVSDMIRCLKPGGQLIIAVPNNNSFLSLDTSCLNMPPHHMGLWDQESLTSLERLFSVKIRKIHYEILQDYHKDYYRWVLHKYSLGLVRNRIGVLSKLLAKFLKLLKSDFLFRYAEKKLAKKYPTLQSYTILVEYIKQ